MSGQVSLPLSRHRALLRVVALLLLPPFLFMLPSGASAAPLIAPATVVPPGEPNGWAIVEWDLGGGGIGIPGQGVGCRTALRYVGEGEGVEWGEGTCWGEFDSSPYGSQPAEPGSLFIVDGYGLTLDGPGCNVIPSGGTLGEHAKDGALAVRSTLPSGSAMTDLPECQIVELCLEVYAQYLGNDEAKFGCVDLSELGFPEEEEEGGSCFAGTPIQLRWVDSGTTNSGGTPILHVQVKFDPATPTNSWAWAAFQGSSLVAVQASGLGASVDGWRHAGTYESPTGVAGAPTTTTIHMFDTWPSDQPSRDLRGLPNYWDRVVPAGFAGATIPEDCVFTFGAKVVDTPDETYDEPWAPYDTPYEPPQTEAPPIIEEDDPAPADESSFWKQLLVAVAAVAAAVWALPGLIANAILGPIEAMMRGLFEPSPGYWSLNMAKLKTDWRATTPGLWLEGFDPNVGSVSGCGGLLVDVPPPVDVEFNIGDACPGTTLEPVAGLAKTVLSAVIVFMGAASCIRSLLAGFGYQFHILQRTNTGADAA